MVDFAMVCAPRAVVCFGGQAASSLSVTIQILSLVCTFFAFLVLFRQIMFFRGTSDSLFSSLQTNYVLQGYF